MDKTEDSGVGADTQGQCQDGDCGEDRILAKGAQSVTNITQESIQCGAGPGIGVGLALEVREQRSPRAVNPQ